MNHDNLRAKAMGPLDYAEAHVRSALEEYDDTADLRAALDFIQHAREERDQLRAEVERLLGEVNRICEVEAHYWKERNHDGVAAADNIAFWVKKLRPAHANPNRKDSDE